MTRKKTILYFIDYRKAKMFTVEKNRILVEVTPNFVSADLEKLIRLFKRDIQMVLDKGNKFLVIYF